MSQILERPKNLHNLSQNELFLQGIFNVTQLGGHGRLIYEVIIFPPLVRIQIVLFPSNG